MARVKVVMAIRVQIRGLDFVSIIICSGLSQLLTPGVVHGPLAINAAAGTSSRAPGEGCYLTCFAD